jgi:hypothetical protein
MMQEAKHCPTHLKLFLFPLLILISCKAYPQEFLLLNAFAHNDYWHKRPLYDALDNGYTHIEADIYLRGVKLVVAHMLPILKKQKTLERLYFAPLAHCINGKNQIACPAYPVMLMIATLALLKLTEVLWLNQTISWREVFFMMLIMVGILGLKYYSTAVE